MLKKKREKRIVIKDPRLQRLRINLRLVLLNMYLDQYSFLRTLSLSAEGDEFKEIHRKIGQFHFIFDNSIVNCSACTRIEGDRYYYPRHHCWYCMDCFNNGHINKKLIYKDPFS